MKNKKGFTLIELLAVIVILAIIALIATPIILNMINDARKSAAVDSTYGYIEAIEYQNSMNQLNSKYDRIDSGEVTSLNSKVNVKGTKPTSGDVEVDSSGRVIKATLCINGHNIEYIEGKATAIDNKCGSNSEEENPPTIIVSEISTEWATSDEVTIELGAGGKGLSGFAVTRNATIPTNWITLSGTSKKLKYTATSNGTYYVHAKSSSGLTSYKSFEISYVDNTAPKLTILPTLVNGSQIRPPSTIYVACTDDNSGMKQVELTVQGSTVTAKNNASISIVPGTNTIYAICTDNIGNKVQVNKTYNGVVGENSIPLCSIKYNYSSLTCNSSGGTCLPDTSLEDLCSCYICE